MYSKALAFASIISVAAAQFSNSSSPNTDEVFLTAHNSARAVVGVGPLSWSDTLADYAQNYSEQRMGDCQLVDSGGPYGENLISFANSELMSVKDAVDHWVSEKWNYDYDTNTCAEGKVCNHYTQVVWEATALIGCAGVYCHGGGVFMICNYSPAGNVAGQRPYQVPDVLFTNWGRIQCGVHIVP